MCVWKKNAGFDEVGAWRTDYIIGFAAGEPAGMRRQNARVHAKLLDEAFTSLFRTSYEASTDRDAAIAGMLAILNDGSKSACPRRPGFSPIIPPAACLSTWPPARW